MKNIFASALALTRESRSGLVMSDAVSTKSAHSIRSIWLGSCGHSFGPSSPCVSCSPYCFSTPAPSYVLLWRSSATATPTFSSSSPLMIMASELGIRGPRSFEFRRIRMGKDSSLSTRDFHQFPSARPMGDGSCRTYGRAPSNIQ